MVLVGCSSPVGPDYGPMAIVQDDSTSITGVNGGTGTIRIRPDCVVFVQDGGRGERTLVWRAGHASWNGALREVIFDPPYAERLVLADGDRVDIGGSMPSAEQWLKAPGADCPTDRFVVSEVEGL